MGVRTFPPGNGEAHVRPQTRKPAWMLRLESRIASLRVKIGRLTQYKRGNRSGRLVRQVKEIVKPVELLNLSELNITEILDTHVQRLSALAKRMRRYVECSKRKQQNRMFNTNEREFYNHIRKEKPNYSEGLPEIGQVNLGMAYIDYKKAYDSVPHTYLIKVLELYKIDDGVIRLMKHAMRMWNTSLHITDGATVLRSRTLSIRRGIFQGDTFSTLWFCLAMNPLSRTLNRTSYGYKLKSGTTRTKITHTFYMDDLKLFAETKDQLHQLLQVVSTFSNDIRMELGIDKCRLVNIHRSKVMDAKSFRVNPREEIRSMVEGESYKYLGFLQLKGIHHTMIKKELQENFLHRINRIMKTFLSAGNKINAINTFAVPLLTYSFGVVKWTKTDLEAIERALIVSLTKHRSHHPKSATERITLPRSKRGIGVIDIQALCASQIQQLRRYFVESQSRHEIYRTVCEADHGFSAMHLAQHDYQLNCVLKTDEEKIATWKQKELHGTHPHQLEQPHIDKAASNTWLVRGDLFSETEGFRVAIQDRVIATKNYRRYILHENIEDRCRKCNVVGVSIEHVIAGCQALAETAYLNRHNTVAKIVHQQLALKHNLVNCYVPYYKYLPHPVLENDCVKLYWDRAIITDVLIRANRPDIVVYNKRMKRVTLIDIAVPQDQNVLSTFSTKITKYHDLAEELRQMWHLEEVRIVPVVISATGLVPCTLLRSLEELELRTELQVIQKAVVLGTCNIVRRFLNHHN
ncbi:uncharacterized protein LOC128740015 [Sabethes cyaneus]|uniref:uncharacterized protein LOC128740015 n=1 Tax=Sabethes cyaneus TaxID=53552 RepID=UPI00237EB64D|nr:uncharacterized protein LOC128740015 [Sabethes cyaneus]